MSVPSRSNSTVSLPCGQQMHTTACVHNSQRFDLADSWWAGGRAQGARNTCCCCIMQRQPIVRRRMLAAAPVRTADQRTLCCGACGGSSPQLASFGALTPASRRSSSMWACRAASTCAAHAHAHTHTLFHTCHSVCKLQLIGPLIRARPIGVSYQTGASAYRKGLRSRGLTALKDEGRCTCAETTHAPA